MENSGNTINLMKRPDILLLSGWESGVSATRHTEQGLFVWRWAVDKVKGVAMQFFVHPLLGHSRGALRVYQQAVNRIVYRKPHHKPYIQHNGWTRPESGLATPYKNFCPNCTELIVNDSKKRIRITKGVYLPIEHECNSVRVYSLQGHLIEVKAQ